MIPKNIRKDHILRAIKEVNEKGIPKERNSNKYQLLHEGKSYPPKYIISLANTFINGKNLNFQEFSAGQESNRFLEKMGFVIKISGLKEKNSEFSFLDKNIIVSKKTKKHNESCADCKKNITSFLKKIYGNAISNYKLRLGVLPVFFSRNRTL